MHEKFGNRTKWKLTIEFMEVVITCAYLHRHSLDCYLLEGPQLLVPFLLLYFLHCSQFIAHEKCMHGTKKTQ